MSEENVELVGFRVVGGAVDVDQCLTVFEDGAVELNERHRTREAIRLQLDAAELDGLRSALEQIPDGIWRAALPCLALGRVKRALTGAWTIFVPKTSDRDYELRRGQKAIVGQKVKLGDYVHISAAVTLLDALLVRAVRAEPR